MPNIRLPRPRGPFRRSALTGVGVVAALTAVLALAASPSRAREAVPANPPDPTPIRVCENGRPTGPGLPEHRQAEVLDTVLRASIVRDDYDPKPAFERLRQTLADPRRVPDLRGPLTNP